MDPFEQQHGSILISDDPRRIQVDVVFAFLSQRSYWATGRSLETVQLSIENSLCMGIYEQGRQLGFARLVTDYATFAWLCDVFVLESERGRGLGKLLIQAVVAHPRLKGLKWMLLATYDAHGLYQEYGGFELLKNPDRWMSRSMV
jgi:GNAT superfamily N-acetyltransferase